MCRYIYNIHFVYIYNRYIRIRNKIKLIISFNNRAAIHDQSCCLPRARILLNHTETHVTNKIQFYSLLYINNPQTER